ncbi:MULTISPECIES: ATP-binding protein [unclassified Streptomyces]|uniref:ATP-binding protein n=1 Tax=unclassified Streptomyces TaxID=2593676 RepID=UPI002DDAAC38|nr:ATP-binding protein [Streptomyces sp. NBC_01257]WRZ65227.1 ATP-binding protein [Streptomyces sp. NBC_01257]WSU59226.1 ATP-binding protein [Streptomyces sp. NBC_01104]
MGTTRQHPPGDLGREPEGAGVGARADAGIRADAGVGAPSSGQVESAERQWRTLSLRQVSGIVPTARDFARQALHDWGWLPAASADRRAAAEDVLLVVSELVTNACLHADGPDELRIARSSKALRVEVADGGAGQPAPRTPHRAGRPGGHGMFIVQRLCLDWGVVRVPGEPGKTVWAELAAPV